MESLCRVLGDGRGGTDVILVFLCVRSLASTGRSSSRAGRSVRVGPKIRSRHRLSRLIVFWWRLHGIRNLQCLRYIVELCLCMLSQVALFVI